MIAVIWDDGGSLPQEGSEALSPAVGLKACQVSFVWLFSVPLTLNPLKKHNPISAIGTDTMMSDVVTLPGSWQVEVPRTHPPPGDPRPTRLQPGAAVGRSRCGQWCRGRRKKEEGAESCKAQGRSGSTNCFHGEETCCSSHLRPETQPTPAHVCWDPLYSCHLRWGRGFLTGPRRRLSSCLCRGPRGPRDASPLSRARAASHPGTCPHGGWCQPPLPWSLS